jgi:hypothetical protein
MQVHIEGLAEYIEQRVRAAVAEALGARPDEDPWLDSAAAATYLGVKRQRIHDLVCSGDLPRIGEKGERLYFRRSTLDAYRVGRSLKRGTDTEVPTLEDEGVPVTRNAPAALTRSGAGHGG